VQDQFGGIDRRSAVREVVRKQRLAVGRRLRNEGGMTAIWLVLLLLLLMLCCVWVVYGLCGCGCGCTSGGEGLRG
jgi:hypothetical protein